MILTDREIQISLESKAIIVEPTPTEIQYSSTSLDLTLDKTLTIFKKPKIGVSLCIDPATSGFNHEDVLSELGTEFEIDEIKGYEFQPHEMLLAWTKEYVELPYNSRIAARVEGKSSLARLGIGVHLTAPTIHAGFKGQIRLEMVNHNVMPIRLRVDMRVCQLIFEQTVGTPVRGYKGRFAGQMAGAKKG
ncbi:MULTISPECIES: dCTP deaminase [unclassified Mesorhizobium]|uniref:dCTP deaminase n=1 Tax=unclassified Mesorhizobium TaxID=325217 RepID=UPI001129EAE6|nr:MULTISPECIES: dCTP deaminase [unclassified Mesorhizobium]TPK89645.1 dCTP deaminase [Mesorhizobium sp. B2-4-17]TPL06798.1 dCTP deaminase [Mesorhizobium sp. B2-4-14]